MKTLVAVLFALMIWVGCGEKGEPTPKAEPEFTSEAKPSRPKQLVEAVQGKQ